MLIGLMSDETYEYRIYKNEKGIYLHKITNHGVIAVSKNEAIALFKNIVKSQRRFLKKSNGYDVYIDEAGNKRFFKNGKENFKMFFHLNGEDATSYKDKKSIDYKIRRFVFLHKKKINLICSLVLLVEFSFLLTDARSPLSDKYFDIKDKTHYVMVGEYTSEDLINYIKDSNGENLDEVKKEFFSNKTFFDDVIKYDNSNGVSFFIEKLENFNIEYFEEDYVSENDAIGEYRPLQINRIFLKDGTINTFNLSAAHEFVHLMQQPFKYIYIREACAEIMAWEYFNSEPYSYGDQRKRIYLLTDIIGTDLMFEANFNLNTSNFENEIKSLLGENEANDLLELFNTSPFSDDIESVNKKIDDYLFKMYKIKYGEDAFVKNKAYIDRIYSDDYLKSYSQNRFYFNKHDYRYYKNDVIDYNEFHSEEIDFNEIDENEVEKIFLEKWYPISKEEFDKFKDYQMNYFKYEDAIEGYNLLPNGAVIDLKEKKVISKENAEKKGLIQTYYGFIRMEELPSLNDIPDSLNLCENCTIVLKDGTFIYKDWAVTYKSTASKNNYYYLLDHIDYDGSTSKKISM